MAIKTRSVDWQGLRARNWYVLVIYAIAILLVVAALQFLLLQPYLRIMKTRELSQIGGTAVADIHDSSPDLFDKLQTLAYTSNVNIVVVDDGGYIINQGARQALFNGTSDASDQATAICVLNPITVSVSTPGATSSPDQPGASPSPSPGPGNSGATGTLTWGDSCARDEIWVPLGQKTVNLTIRQQLQNLLDILKANDNRPIVRYTPTDRNGNALAIYFAQVQWPNSPGNNPPRSSQYLTITSSIPSSNSQVAVLQSGFIIVTLIVLLLTLVAAQIISDLLAKPITGLTRSAKRLASGDLKTRFDGAGVTETQELATTLNNATKQLAELEEDRRDFLANVSHDLRTPLTIIQAHAELIRDISAGNVERSTKHAATIISEATRLTDMVNEILEISRLEIGATEMPMEKTDLAVLARETMASFASLGEQQGYSFTTSIDETAPVFGSPNYLKRVLYNLIGNAVNYTGDDKHVTVRLLSRGARVRFSVTDSGAGIAPEEMTMIWNRYSRSRNSHARAVIGTGLGLSIVRHILTRHHARFGIDSTLGHGSTFWFTLPVIDSSTEMQNPSHTLT